MSDGMFRTVSSVRHGYDPDEVDEFFAHAQHERTKLFLSQILR